MSLNHLSCDNETSLSATNSDLKEISTKYAERKEPHLHLPQTQSKLRNTNICDGIISEQMAIGRGRSEFLSHPGRLSSVFSNDSKIYLPVLSPQISVLVGNGNGIRSCSRDGEDTGFKNNLLSNLRRRPQTAQPVSNSSTRRQLPSESHMGPDASLRGDMYARLRPATASAIRCTDNSAPLSRLDQEKVHHSIDQFYQLCCFLHTEWCKLINYIAF